MLEAAASSAEVVGGRSVLHAPFAHLVLCKRIPGAGWDAARRAWVYPATLRHAQMIRASIPRLESNGDFQALLASCAPVGDVKPPEPAPAVALPAGLRTRPWRHQIAAFDFCRELFAAGHTGILLAMGMGTGKTLVAIMLLLFLRARRWPCTRDCFDSGIDFAVNRSTGGGTPDGSAVKS